MSHEDLIFLAGVVFQAGICIGTGWWVVHVVKDHEHRLRKLEKSDAERRGSEQARLGGVHQPSL